MLFRNVYDCEVFINPKYVSSVYFFHEDEPDYFCDDCPRIYARVYVSNRSVGFIAGSTQEYNFGKDQLEKVRELVRHLDETLENRFTRRMQILPAKGAI